MRSGQAEMNRPWFLSALGRDWFPSVPDTHERLGAGGRVADIGCGEGWSSISIAVAYPEVTVDAFDIDPKPPPLAGEARAPSGASGGGQPNKHQYATDKPSP